MEKEFEPEYAFVASDSMELMIKIANYIGKKYLELVQSTSAMVEAD
jgi:hypothetical protein